MSYRRRPCTYTRPHDTHEPFMHGAIVSSAMADTNSGMRPRHKRYHTGKQNYRFWDRQSVIISRCCRCPLTYDRTYGTMHDHDQDAKQSLEFL
jgi:hypothetical protein